MKLASSVAKTKAYGSYFNFPLSPEETHYWLIASRLVSFASLKKYLLPLTPKENTQKNTLLQYTLQKEKFAQEIYKIARFIPFIRLIALTGSVAANNSRKNDDLDLLIVTDTNTLWLVRPIFLLFLSLGFNRRHPGDNPYKVSNAFCPNLWLDTKSLSIPLSRRNLYTAHEVLQVKPILDRGYTHARFIKANSWTKHYLANAYSSLSKIKAENPVIPSKVVIYTNLLIPLNLIAFILQYLYMLPKKTTETVTLHSAFFHKSNPSDKLFNYLKNNSL